MKKLIILTLLVTTASGCAPLLLAGGGAVSIKGAVNDTEHSDKLRKHSTTLDDNLSKVKEHSKTINSNLLKTNVNIKDIMSLHNKIKMLEVKIINLQKPLPEKPQPTQVIGGSDNVVR